MHRYGRGTLALMNFKSHPCIYAQPYLSQKHRNKSCSAPEEPIFSHHTIINLKMCQNIDTKSEKKIKKLTYLTLKNPHRFLFSKYVT